MLWLFKCKREYLSSIRIISISVSIRQKVVLWPSFAGSSISPVAVPFLFKTSFDDERRQVSCRYTVVIVAVTARLVFFPCTSAARALEGCSCYLHLLVYDINVIGRRKKKSKNSLIIFTFCRVFMSATTVLVHNGLSEDKSRKLQMQLMMEKLRSKGLQSQYKPLTDLIKNVKLALLVSNILSGHFFFVLFPSRYLIRE